MVSAAATLTTSPAPAPNPSSAAALTLTNVLYEKKGAIAYVTINRPKVLNALNTPTWSDLKVAFEDAKARSALAEFLAEGRVRSERVSLPHLAFETPKTGRAEGALLARSGPIDPARNDGLLAARARRHRASSTPRRVTSSLPPMSSGCHAARRILLACGC